jgi:hypothetical protein
VELAFSEVRNPWQLQGDPSGTSTGRLGDAGALLASAVAAGSRTLHRTEDGRTGPARGSPMVEQARRIRGNVQLEAQRGCAGAPANLQPEHVLISPDYLTALAPRYGARATRVAL